MMFRCKRMRSLADQMFKTCVKEESVILHCHLLEHFVSAKAKVDIWAERNLIATDVAWNVYINLGIHRFKQWVQASYDNTVDLDSHIPPLDVLLVWHAFLQAPEKWDAFAIETRIDFARWNPVALFRALHNDRPGEFKLQDDSLVIVDDMYDCHDVRSLMDTSLAYIYSTRPNKETQAWVQTYMDKKVTHTIQTPQGSFTFDYDFHQVIRLQLDLAERILKFSWHRMYVSPVENRQGFEFAIKRYSKFLAVAQLKVYHSLRVSMDTETLSLTSPDIDLVWRTHMLAPGEYLEFCVENNNFEGLSLTTPRPPESHEAADNAFDFVYWVVFRERYELCLCWPCVDGRRPDVQGSCHLKRPTQSAIRTQLSEEMDRRRAAAVSIPLEFASKQCRKCGLHPRKHCGQRDTAENTEAEPSTLRRPVVDRVPTPASSIRVAPLIGDDSPPALPFAMLQMSPHRSEILAQTPLQDHFPPPPVAAPAPLEPAPRAKDLELHNDSRSRSTTPGLTIGSTQSGGSYDDDGPGNDTLERPSAWEPPQNWHSIPSAGRGLTRHINNRNANAMRDNTEGSSSVRQLTSPDPGAWLAS
ncbi:hypothetical protein FSARC_12612 [Fusarium sarcochroum]|uniref:Uncharacterized protein n=1 Tax=Fusarium sarcochroum TaxID=1208366 RepID=A0A8H4WWF0_9HYPO|nr:hypothetical protein FSARC_12612 [Fusarium sarcochroum]